MAILGNYVILKTLSLNEDVMPSCCKQILEFHYFGLKR